MARSLQFSVHGREVSCAIEKLDRNKQYGWVEKKAFDKHGNECYFGSISADGQHIFAKESFELGYQSDDGTWLERSQLQMVDMDDQLLQQQEASFKQLIALEDTVSVDTYLMHVAKSVYHLAAADAELLQAVRENPEIYAFPFNYSAGYKTDSAFLIENQGALFMVVGQHCGFEFLGQQAADSALLQHEPEADDEADDADEDDIDYSMF